MRERGAIGSALSFALRLLRTRVARCGAIPLEWEYMTQKRQKTVGVKVGNVQVGGGAPIVVQSMTNTDTADIASTAQQCFELAQAGSELVRITVNVPE